MADLMTLEQLANYLLVTKKTIYRLLERNGIPAMKVGRQWRFDKISIDAWLRQSSAKVVANILVIDDDETLCALFQDTLQGERHIVTTVSESSKGLELAKEKCRDGRAQNEGDDLRPNVLDESGAVEPQRPSDVPLEAGHADAHVLRVARVLQKWGEQPDDSPSQDDAPARGKETGKTFRHGSNLLKDMVSTHPSADLLRASARNTAWATQNRRRHTPAAAVVPAGGDTTFRLRARSHHRPLTCAARPASANRRPRPSLMCGGDAT